MAASGRPLSHAYSVTIQAGRLSPRHCCLLVVLTHLLTTALDDCGCEQTEERSEQDRSEPVDIAGRLYSFS